jgi:protein O-GlcNAc transferase
MMAEPALENALTLLPNDAGWSYYLGYLKLRGDRPEEAIVDFERVLGLQPDSPIANVRMAAAQKELGDLESAAIYLQVALLKDPDMAHAYAQLGEVLAELGDAQQAIAMLQKALELQPTANSLYHVLGRMFQELGDENRAEQLMDLGRFGEAVPAYQAVIRAEPSSADAYVGLAGALMLTNDMRGGLEAIELDPTDSQAHFNLGSFKDVEALEVIEGAAEAYPIEIMYQDGLARLLASADDEVRDGARALEMAEAMVQAGKTIETMDVLAMAYAESGDTELALRAVDDAISLAKAQRSPAIMMDHQESNRARYLAGKPSRTTWPGFLMEQ